MNCQLVRVFLSDYLFRRTETRKAYGRAVLEQSTAQSRDRNNFFFFFFFSSISVQAFPVEQFKVSRDCLRAVDSNCHGDDSASNYVQISIINEQKQQIFFY